MRNWKPGKLHQIVLFVIIIGLSVFALVINNAETKSDFTPRAKQFLADTGNLTLKKPFDVKRLRQWMDERVAARRSGES